MSTVTAGKLGEDTAVKLLLKKGYRVLARNFRSKLGEIDIVAQDGKTLVFVEVKTRWSDKFGYPQESVTRRKLASIARTGGYFKLLHPQTPDSLRIDVVALEVRQNKVISAELIKNASY